MKKNIPNILSSLRMIMAPIFLVLFIQDDVWLRSLSLVVFAIAAITDFFDGYYARQYKLESNFGIFLDPLADKFLTFSGFICLPFLDTSQFPWWAVIVIMIRDIIVTLLRIYSDRKNIVLQTRATAKAKTAIQMIFLYAALLFGLLLILPDPFSSFVQTTFELNIFFWGMMGVVAITVYSGVEYLFVNRDLFKSNS